jgi:hypothetical protein
MNRFILLFTAILCYFSGASQEVRISLGTEFPLQHYIGINYQHNQKLSADLSFGIVDSPYNDELYDWIRVPSKHQARKDFLQALTDDGSVFGFGVNFHHNKWYFGVHGQFIKLNASGSYDEILSSDLVQEEFTSEEKMVLDSVLTILRSPFGGLILNLNNRVSMETSLFQLGIKVGRRFQFNNPKLSMNVELGITANVNAKTKTTYDRSLYSRVEGIARNQLSASSGDLILENLNFDERGEEVNQFFEDYGYIPGLRIGFSYLLYRK